MYVYNTLQIRCHQPSPQCFCSFSRPHVTCLLHRIARSIDTSAALAYPKVVEVGGKSEGALYGCFWDGERMEDMDMCRNVMN